MTFWQFTLSNLDVLAFMFFGNVVMVLLVRLMSRP